MKILIISITSLFMSFSSMADIGFRLNPVTALVGFADISLDLPIGDSLRLTPTMQYWNLTLPDSTTNESSTFKVNGLGADLTFHFGNNFASGLYLGAFFSKMNFEYESEALNESGEADITTAGAILGYQWCWTSFYMNLAARFGSASAESTITVQNSTTGEDTGTEEDTPTGGGSLEFKLGWRF